MDVFLTIIILLPLILAYWSLRKKMIGPMLICLGVACGGIAAYMDMELTAILLLAVANGGVLYILYSAALSRSTQQPFLLLLFLWFISWIGIITYELPSHLRLLYGIGKPTPITIVFISILILTFLTFAYKSFHEKMIDIMSIYLGVAGAFLAISMGMEATALLLFGIINLGIAAHAFIFMEVFENGHYLGHEWKLILLAWLLSLFGLWDVGSCRFLSCKFALWPGEFISILIPTLLVFAFWSSRKKIETLRKVSLTLVRAFVVVGIVDSSFSPIQLKWWYGDYPYLNLLPLIFLLLLFGRAGVVSLVDMNEPRQYGFPWKLIWFFVGFLSLFGFIVYLHHFLLPGYGSWG